MAALARLLASGNVSKSTASDDFGRQKEPIKASQFEIHSELCASPTPAEEIGSKLGGNIGCKKPPQIERTKSLMVHSNQGTSSVSERPISEPLDSSGVSTSQSQSGTPSIEAKRMISSQATTIKNLRKRSIMVTNHGPPPTLDNFAPASGVISPATICGNEYP